MVYIKSRNKDKQHQACHIQLGERIRVYITVDIRKVRLSLPLFDCPCISYVLTYVTLISLYHHKRYNAHLQDLNNVAVVPRKLVLNTPYSDDVDNESYSNWDTKLSCMLWDECQKGKESLYYG